MRGPAAVRDGRFWQAIPGLFNGAIRARGDFGECAACPTASMEITDDAVFEPTPVFPARSSMEQKTFTQIGRTNRRTDRTIG